MYSLKVFFINPKLNKWRNKKNIYHEILFHSFSNREWMFCYKNKLWKSVGHSIRAQFWFNRFSLTTNKSQMENKSH